MPVAALAAVLDLVIAALIALSVSGGIPWRGHVILRHAADPRRAALLLGLAAALALPALRRQSRWLRLAGAFWTWLETRRGRRIALSCGLGLAVVTGALQCLALRVPMYDVGLFHQILWAISHGKGFVSTISGAGDFLLDHLSPTLALFAPLSALTMSSPLLLPVVHPVLLYVGIAAWVWLAEQLGKGKPWGPALAAGAVLFGISFDSLWGNFRWGFHENAPAFAALSWAFALLLARPARSPRLKLGILALFLLAAGCKEILVVDVAFALAIWAWRERRRQAGFALLLLAASVALVCVFIWFEKIPHPADKNYFDRYYAYLGHGLGAFFGTLLTRPWVVVRAIGAGALLRYFFTVLLPWLFLPIAALRLARGESVWLLAAAPSLASAALSTDVSLRGSSFHYVLELWPVLAALTIVVLARLRKPRAWALAWAFAALLAFDHDPLGDLREYLPGAIDQTPVRAAFLAVPPGDGVSADELSGTWLAGREGVTRWAALDAFAGRCPDWVVVRGGEQLEGVRRRCGEDRCEVKRAREWTFLKRCPDPLKPSSENRS